MDTGYTRGYIDRGKICHQFSLLICTSFIGQLVHPVGGGKDGVKEDNWLF